MQLSTYFIYRPRFAGVIAIVLILLGLLALYVLPISQYPHITPPQMVVTTTYPGASAKVVLETVGVPIENALNGVDDMMYMISSATDDGNYTLTITFDMTTNADIAQVKVENLLKQATPYLPSEVIDEGVFIQPQSAGILGFIVLESPDNSFTDLQLSNYAYTTIKNPLHRVHGVSGVTVYGPQDSMRVWLDSEKMRALNLTSEDIASAIKNQNSQATLGSLGSAPATKGTKQVFTVLGEGLLNNVADFENIIVSAGKNGALVRLKEVAFVEIGADSYSVNAKYNNKSSVVLTLNQLPNSNAIDIMDNVAKKVAQLQKRLPNGMQLSIPYNSVDFVKISIQDIITTLCITFLLVMLVIFLFLQNAKATLIPMITIPVSLIGTFSILYLIGFDINILTLFAGVLAIGLVVDDAIVVVERVAYLITYKKLNPVKAAVQAMKDIGSSVIATSLVLLAIFVPVSLMAGLTGKIYQQFAITIIIAILLSAVNALTFSPALCSILLKSQKNKKDTKRGFFTHFNALVDWLTAHFITISHFFATHLKIFLCLMGIIFAVIITGFIKIPKSFIPTEDQGVLFSTLQLPQNSSIAQTQEALDKMGEEILKMPGVAYYIGVAGQSLISGYGENVGMSVVGLTPWNKRTTPNLSIESINKQLTDRFSRTIEYEIEFFPLPSIPGIGNSGGISLQFNALNANADMSQLQEKLATFLSNLNATNLFSYAISTIAPDSPHIFLDINREKLQLYGLSVADVFDIMGQLFGSSYINTIAKAGQVNKVIIQGNAQSRQSIENIENAYLKTKSGQMVQLKEFISHDIKMYPKSINRYNQYLTAAIMAQTKPDVSSGAALDSITHIASQLGPDFDMAWTGLSLQQAETKGLALILLFLAIIFAYLFLVALYESWILAFSVIFVNVFGVLGALAGLYLRDLPLSIYAQLGVILLIGLASKNAILMVQFMNMYTRQGHSIIDSAILGAKERFRAVIMTALTFILGVMPMVFATGPSAASQQSLGTSVVFGMISATFIGIFFIPALFVLFKSMIKISKRQELDNKITDKGEQLQ